MARWSVDISRQVPQVARVSVEADTQEEAIEKVSRAVQNGKANWRNSYFRPVFDVEQVIKEQDERAR